MNDGQENARVSAAEEGEVSSEAGTLLNVVPGSIRAKPELHEANMCSARNDVTRLGWSLAEPCSSANPFRASFWMAEVRSKLPMQW